MVLELIQEQPEVIQAIFRKDKAALEQLLGTAQTFFQTGGLLTKFLKFYSSDTEGASYNYLHNLQGSM